jgi:maltose O-acetyltransferase
MFNWIIKKIKNQFIKLDKIIYASKLNKFKKTFKSCGENVSLHLPICIMGPECVSIGDNVTINAFVHMWGHGGIVIGNNCLIASHCAITSLTHNPESLLFNEQNIAKPVIIGENVWIGSHVIILPGVTLGDNIIIGAGSLVNKDLASNSVYAGTPVKKLRDLEQFKKS